MLTIIKAFFGKYLFALEIGAAALAAAVIGWQHMHVLSLQATVATNKAAYATQVARAESAAVAESEKNRAIEAADAAKLRKAQDDYATLQTVHASALAAQRVVLADNGKLRSAVAAYASGSGQAAPDTAASASQRAARLGELLAAALQADAEHASAAESNGDAVRALLAAWPSTDQP